MTEIELLEMMKTILDVIDTAERNQYPSEALDIMYKAKDAIANDLKKFA